MYIVAMDSSETLTLVGAVSAVVDSNGKVALPSAFRELLGNEKRFYLVKGKNNSLILYREKDFNENERPKLLALPPEEKINATINSQFITLDERQNRFLLVEKFKQHAGITKEIVFVGAITRIQIYSAENFEKLKNSMGDYEYE